MERDENREPQEGDAEAAEDLEVTGDEAEGVAGGVRKAGGGQQEYLDADRQRA